jgi:ribosome biogenesis protein Tsr3
VKLSDLIKDIRKIETLLQKHLQSLSKKQAEAVLVYVNDALLLYKIATTFKIVLPSEKEKILLEDSSHLAFEYCINVKKAKWKELETAIKNFSNLAVDYAQHILKDRFKEAESTIKLNKYQLSRYKTFLSEIGKLEEFLRE